MEKLSGLNQIVQVLRRQLASRADSTARAGATSTARASADTPALSKASVEELRARIGRRIQSLPSEDEHERQAVQVFVESVLAWEFGENLLNDARTGELTARIRDQLLQDPELRAKIDRLLAELTR